MYLSLKKSVLKKIPAQVITLFLILFSINLGSANAYAAKDLSSYDKQIETNQSKAQEFNSKIEEYSKSLENLVIEANSLNDYIKQTEKETKELDDAITNLNLLLSQLEGRKAEIEKEQSDLKEQMKGMYKQMVKNQNVNLIQVVLENQTIAGTLGDIYNISSLQSRALTLLNKIEENQKEIENNIEQSKLSKAKLNAAREILKAKKSQYNENLKTIENKQENFETLKTSLAEQKKKVESESQDIIRARELQAKINQEEEAKRKKELEVVNKASSGGIKSIGNVVTPPTRGRCGFEDGRSLNLPAGFFSKPVDGIVSQWFHCGHDGVDIAAPSGTEIKAIAPGTIVEKGYQTGGFGNYVVVKINLPDGTSIYNLNAHMIAPSSVGRGTRVNRGEVIGYVGSTGWSTGPHNHFMLISDTAETTNNYACLYGGSTKSYCYDPSKYISF